MLQYHVTQQDSGFDNVAHGEAGSLNNGTHVGQALPVAGQGQRMQTTINQ